MPPPASGLPFSAPLLLKLAAAGALSFVVVALVPHTVSANGSVPPVRMLLVTAVLVGLICAGALFWGIQSDLSLPTKVAVYTVGFNALVIVVKLVLAPHGYYEVNQVTDVETPIDNGFAAVLAAVLVFALYLAAYVVLYRLFRRRIQHLAVLDPVPRLFGSRALVLSVVVGVLLLVGSGGALLIVLLPLFGGLEYLGFIFSSTVSGLIALALVGATSLAALAFDASSERARVVGDATLFMSFFWVGLYFLALYHVLWVVYVLVLTSIWPLKVVTTK
ncbi:MAG TPA: hypothetical protein VE736_13455 [Gaiellaceae bacterium]|jgi:hypothetical protein|nr:hypothetical protein [Gaiellaceae bacterium]